jgi:hypothetical protein
MSRQVARHNDILTHCFLGRSKPWPMECLDPLIGCRPGFLDLRLPRPIVATVSKPLLATGFNHPLGTSIPSLLHEPETKVPGYLANKDPITPRPHHQQAPADNLVPSTHRPPCSMALIGGSSGLIHCLDGSVDDPGSNFTNSPHPAWLSCSTPLQGDRGTSTLVRPWSQDDRCFMVTQVLLEA